MPKFYSLVVLPGEGIGPEVTSVSLRVLETVAAIKDFRIQIQPGLIGNSALQRTGFYFPKETEDLCAQSDGILFGSVSQGGILELRQRFDFFVNLRPVIVYPDLVNQSSLKPDRIHKLDILFVRELVSGIYYGPSGREIDEKGQYGYHTMKYYEYEIIRIAYIALLQAQKRDRRLTVAHKQNALPHIPWSSLVDQEASNFPDVAVNHMLVDNLAMQLVKNPSQFDVILACNLFGDIISDIGGALVGSIGLLPSASLNADGLGLYEAVHGTAPEISGQGIANPMGTLGSIVMMLRQWGEDQAADLLSQAQSEVIKRGFRTPDLSGLDGSKVLGTLDFTEKLIDCVQDLA